MKIYHHTCHSRSKQNNPLPGLPMSRYARTVTVLLASVVPMISATAEETAPSLLTAFQTEDTALFSLSATAPLAANAPAISLANFPRAGWQATLSTRAHGVRGTVTIVDADTFRVDNFFYDGGGIDVHFILAAADDNSTFRTARLVTDPNLLGMAHNGDSITIDLPAGTTFDGYNAVSLWCLPAQANFGSGTFIDPVPEPTSVSMVAIGAVALRSFARRRPKPHQASS